jgi:hypothetical protein
VAAAFDARSARKSALSGRVVVWVVVIVVTRGFPRVFHAFSEGPHAFAQATSDFAQPIPTEKDEEHEDDDS